MRKKEEKKELDMEKVIDSATEKEGTRVRIGQRNTSSKFKRIMKSKLGRRRRRTRRSMRRGAER